MATCTHTVFSLLYIDLHYTIESPESGSESMPMPSLSSVRCCVIVAIAMAAELLRRLAAAMPSTAITTRPPCKVANPPMLISSAAPPVLTRSAHMSPVKPESHTQVAVAVPPAAASSLWHLPCAPQATVSQMSNELHCSPYQPASHAHWPRGPAHCPCSPQSTGHTVWHPSPLQPISQTH